VTLYLFPGQQKGDRKKQQQELYKQILGNLEVIKAGNISVINSEVEAVDFYTKERKFRALNTSIGLTDVAIDSTYNQDPNRTLFCKEITIESEKVVLGEKNKTAEITKASFDTKSQVLTLEKFEYDAFKSNGFFKSSLEGIALKGITWLGPVENSDLAIDEAVLNAGDIETLKPANSKKKPSKKNKAILTGWIKSFTINSFKLKSFTWTNKVEGSPKSTITLQNNSLLLKGLMIDRTALINESLLEKFKEIELTNDLISLTSKDKMYQYKFSGCRLNTASRNLSIKSLRIIPALNEAAFAKKARYQVDRYNINIQNVECSGVNFKNLVNGEIDVKRIATNNNSINIFRDLSYPIDSASKEENQQNFPHQVLYKTNFHVRVDEFISTKTYIEYKEKNAKSKSSGRVRFSNSSITINNISNHEPKPGEKILLRFSSTFLEKIPINATIAFYKHNWQKGRFEVQSEVTENFDAAILSQITQPMALIKIEKGTVNSLNLNITADTGFSRGTLKLPYRNMKVSFLKKKGDEYNKKDVFSLFANLIVKNKNEEGPGMRTANIDLPRNRYKSFFNFIWMSLFTGIKDVFMIKI
jgi:hypothetical protein